MARIEPSSAFQTRRDLSAATVAISLPSRLQATPVTPALWPIRSSFTESLVRS